MPKLAKDLSMILFDLKYKIICTVPLGKCWTNAYPKLVNNVGPTRLREELCRVAMFT